jgi:hypothetical protein
MALRAWTGGDMQLAERLLLWVSPSGAGGSAAAGLAGGPERSGDHQTRQAATPLWRWQMAS